MSKAGSLPWTWGVNPVEMAATYHCDELAAPDRRRLLRGVSVAAPAELVFAWLGNLRFAPYSYDLVDNWGRRSPRSLRTDLPDLAAGQRVMTMFTAVRVIDPRELTIRAHPGPGRTVFGDVVVTYDVSPSASGTRLVAAIRFGAPASAVGAARVLALAWGDLVMMRRQLLTLRGLAERDALLVAQRT